MYLYVEMFDGWGAYHDAMLGASGSGRKRIVRIKLTDEQIAQIQPKSVGQDGETEHFEDVKPLSIQKN